MAVHVRLAVRPHPPDGWLVTLVPPDNWGVVGAVLDRAAVDALVAAARDCQPPPRRVGHPEVTWARREREAGRAVATLWSRTPEFAAAWGHAVGFARGRGEDLLVHVEAGDPAARAVPWELVAADAETEPLERLGLGSVSRLRPGPEGPAPSGPLRVAAWCPTPDDPACAAVLDHLAERSAAAGAGPILAAGPTTSPPPGPPAFLVLHLVCHGEAGAEWMRLLVGAQPDVPVPFVLTRWLRAAALVVLDVCEAAAALPDPAEVLALAVLDHGARACLAPARPIEVRATRALHTGLYEAFAGGATVAAAVAAARRAICLDALPSAGGRWHVPQLQTRSVAAAVAAPGPRPRLEGWPHLAPDGDELLARTFAEAQSRGTRWVGVEHLLLALADTPGHPEIDGLRAILRGAEVETAIVERIAGWLCTDGRKIPRASPRLVRVVAAVRAGGGVVDIARALVADRGHDLDDLLGEDLPGTIPWDAPDAVLTTLPDGASETLQPDVPQSPPVVEWPDVPAVALEVVGGPEDGLRLAPRPGDTIGRWAPVEGPAVPLFRGSPVTDPMMSRTLLTWHGDGTVTMKGSGHRLRGMEKDLVGPGRVELRAGDLLAPGRRARVRFRALGD